MLQLTRHWITVALATVALMTPTVAEAQTIIYRSVSPSSEHHDYREYRYPRVYRSTPTIRGDIEESVLVRPVIIDSTIEDSTIINPVIVSPRRSSTTVIRERASTEQRNPACMAFSDIRIACQP